MKQVYKLHELIEMAKSGQHFTAQTSFSVPLKEKSFLQKEPWYESFICADWTVRMKREPRVIYHTVYKLTGELSICRYDDKDSASKNGKPIKFIEVIDEV